MWSYQGASGSLESFKDETTGPESMTMSFKCQVSSNDAAQRNTKQYYQQGLSSAAISMASGENDQVSGKL